MNCDPSIFTTNNHQINLKNIYQNTPAFLILSGPSFNEIIKSTSVIQLGNQFLTYKDALHYPSHITMSVNNSVKSFRPNLWSCVDEPNRFLKSIWLDPTIQKFIPHEHMGKKLFDSTKWVDSDITVSQCPNVYGIYRNEKFNHQTFLNENTFNWGDHKNYGGSRSVMLIAIKLLYYLGIREIYLLGCDFYMNEQHKYHFEQDRTRQALNNNNKTYGKMIERFELLKPIFDNAGLKIYNCNCRSELKVFPLIGFEQAMLNVYKKFDIDIIHERVDGLYEREAKLRKEGAKLVQPGRKK